MKVVFVGRSTHIKSVSVLKDLCEMHFLDAGNTLLITDQTNGDIFEIAEKNKLQFKIATKSREIAGLLNGFEFDYLVCCGWHLKIPNEVLTLARKRALNCHSSYLPDYKGLGAYKHAWSNNESYAGASVHIMEEKFDTGEIMSQSKVKLFLRDTPKTILTRIAEQTSLLIIIAIFKLEKGDVGQPNEGGRYFIKTSNVKHVLHRFFNLMAGILGLPRWMTSHKK